MVSIPKFPLRIAIDSFSRHIGQIRGNIARATELCKTIEPHSVDLVCLPEMIFTGYTFPDATSISSVLEEPSAGPTSKFCAELAERLRCYVVTGYPERLRPEEVPSGDEADQPVGANSAVMYGPNGDLINNYRKTNLFDTDKTWAKAGTGFATIKLPPPLRTVCLGICMDLNAQPPYDWTIEEGPYELADHCITHKANLLILLNAWLQSEKGSKDDDTDWSTLNFWAARLRPLWAESDNSVEQPDVDSPGTQRTVVIACNRSGEENGVNFAGSSACFDMKVGSGRPRLLDVMGKDEEGVRIWTFPQ
ncbi:Carbon-nitrogen hydrolase [Pleurotus pulmonarius]|nr:Carbon-nitrogen hydrolase [Pleurotus pulmonarius]KAF4590771.1 Carbon-nitrogen hydrolase [Pleurotus pulmonarius]